MKKICALTVLIALSGCGKSFSDMSPGEKTALIAGGVVLVGAAVVLGDINHSVNSALD